MGYEDLVIDAIEGEGLTDLTRAERRAVLQRAVIAVDGTPLHQVIAGRPLEPARALDYATQIAEALSAAHAAGIVHRDLKPANIMVTRSSGRDAIKVLDFGLAKRVDALPSDARTFSALTRHGAVLGTPAYMAPEQAQGQSVEARADIFSFGAVLYEMLGGRVAFSRDSEINTLMAVMSSTPPPLEGAPAELVRVITRCLEKDPQARYASGTELRAALAGCRVRLEPGPQVYEFGPYRLDIALSRLEREGDPITMPPKAFDLLVLLARNQHRVVAKTELMETLWPNTFVEEGNLTQHIYTLRKALGDRPNGKPYIETVPRRGYRLAPLSALGLGRASVPPLRAGASGTSGSMFGSGPEVREDAPATEPSTDVTTAHASRRTRWVAVAAALAVGLAIAALVAWRVSQGPTSESNLLAGKTRIVVLPFENLTANRQDDWLASAFSDSLTSGLQPVEALIPVSRDRIVELYRQHGIREAAPVDAGVLRQIWQRLSVRYYVHGSYQRMGDQIKVVARLVSVDGGAIQAQETLTDAFDNLLKLEDDLAGRFAARLEVAPRPANTGAETASLEAYQAVIEGRTLYAENRFTDALGPLTRATAIDPRYAQAWALLAKTHARLSTISLISSGSAHNEAQRAVELAPALYDAHVALGLAYREMENVDEWRVEALKAIQLNPRIAEAYELFADSYFAAPAWGCRRDRNPELAERNFRTAIGLDRLLSAPYANLSFHYSWMGRDEDGLRVADEGLAVLPGNALITRGRALALVRLQRPAQAERDVRQMLDAGATMSALDHLILGSVALVRGNADLAAQEFQTTLSRLPTTALELAIARAYLDNRRMEEGLTHLDRAVALEPACARFAATSPGFAPHRDAPQFRARLATWQK